MCALRRVPSLPGVVVYESETFTPPKSIHFRVSDWRWVVREHLPPTHLLTRLKLNLIVFIWTSYRRFRPARLP